ncbi:glycosyl transferase family protein [Litoreibacter albidus]|uniref:Anthranilate phosphoribosyltransferase n=1 Tax=Litoreibacter albidus TaxID=670155 RepID=A0A1H3BSB9_9RHOB|nr:glycosyl transferase family protein [Litoreibacter albidus]SDX44608.1 Anthranilate phosphoribosyltransferase [Litoreibacter albidus]
MTLTPFVRIVARGKGRARTLTFDEARQAMALILAGDAEPEAVGALLMVLRLRGETDAEIAGFTCALRATTPQLPTPDLDWPCYAAGRTRGAPLFLLAAKLVAQAGYSVTLHGWNAHQGPAADVREVLSALRLEGDGLAYLPLEALSPRAFALLNLRDTFGLRSCVNTVLRMWNPAGATASVQGVFHPSYRGLQSRAAALLGDVNLTVIKGGGGEFERNPSKDIAVFGLRNGQDVEEIVPPILPETRRLHAPDHPVDIAALWGGSLEDAFASATVIGTAALALRAVDTTTSMPKATAYAAELWSQRHSITRRAG